MEGMPGMGQMAPPPQSKMAGSGKTPANHHKTLMHMTFFWGKDSVILFSGWPGTDGGMYALALVLTFALAFLGEALSRCRLTRPGMNHIAAGLVLTLAHAVRMGLAYLVMLALMSFNGGVFIVAVAGHLVGFLIFGSGVFGKPVAPAKAERTANLPPMSC